METGNIGNKDNKMKRIEAKERKARMKGQRFFKRHFRKEIEAIEDAVLGKMDYSDVKRMYFISEFNSDHFPSYDIGVGKDDSTHGIVLQCHVFYGEECEFSEISKKNAIHTKLGYSLTFGDPSSVEFFEDRESVVSYIKKNWKKKVEKKYCPKWKDRGIPVFKEDLIVMLTKAIVHEKSKLIATKRSEKKENKIRERIFLLEREVDRTIGRYDTYITVSSANYRKSFNINLLSAATDTTEQKRVL